MTRVKEGPYHDPSQPRTEKFLANVKKGDALISNALRERARHALESDRSSTNGGSGHRTLSASRSNHVSIVDGLTFRYLFIAQGEELPAP